MQELKTKIPTWAKTYLTEKDLQKVEDSIQKAELSTSGELVPVLVRASANTESSKLALFFFIALLHFVFGADQLLNDLASDHLSLDSEYFQVFDFFAVLLSAFIIKSLLLKMPIFERMFLSFSSATQAVEQRAELEFYHSKIKDTRSSTGILIFISLLERQVVVLADQSISEKLPTETWNRVVQEVIAGIRQKDLGKGLCQGIETCSDILAEHFPIEKDDTNELSNHLVIKE